MTLQIERPTDAPTTHVGLLRWVAEVAALAEPDRVHWCDGSEAEWEALTADLVEAGTLTRLGPLAGPSSFHARTDPDDVARVEDRTFICSATPDQAGPTNNWLDPVEMRARLQSLFAGSMHGRTMYVIPFCMGPLDAPDPRFGVEITDSGYVAVSMRIMTRMGAEPLAAMTASEADFVPCLHSVGAPLEPSQPDVAWPCNSEKYIVQFPENREIWSYGSGYGGNSLLGKKCYSLRIASVMARDEGWLAEHMLILRLTSPQGRRVHLAAAFPSACGKTNLAMLAPTLPGWSAETLGDDIAWLRIGDDGRLWATNPEYGLFGVAPGTGWATNPHAMRTLEAGGTLYTNVAVTDLGDVWWEGRSAAPERATDWRGEPWTPDAGRPAAHPNSRFCVPITQCPILADDFDSPTGVPIDAILFGGRRASTIPLVAEAENWEHGVFMGATCSSETTAAANGAVGVVRRDPMAMLPFLGYHAADHLAHWLSMPERTDRSALPRVFHVNWFRRGAGGEWLWPGFGENTRVLKWIVQRLSDEAAGIDSPIGVLPAPGELDLAGLDHDPNLVAAALAVDPQEWRAELPLIEEWFERLERVPQPLWDRLRELRDRLGDD